MQRPKAKLKDIHEAQWLSNDPQSLWAAHGIPTKAARLWQGLGVQRE